MQQTNNTLPFELGFIIRGMKFNVMFEDGFFDDDEKNTIIDFVGSISNEMHIDSSYVEDKDSKYTSTFMLRDGWNALNELIIESNYCKNLHPKSQEVLIDAFCMMGKCYVYECLSLYYDFEHIQVDVDLQHDFDVVITQENPNIWKMYPGKWQTWSNDVLSHKTRKRKDETAIVNKRRMTKDNNN